MSDSKQNCVVDVTPELSRRFAVMSFVSATLIVALHSLSADKAGIVGRAFHSFIAGGICQTAIPWFFFAAGFFLAGHIGEPNWWLCEMSKRVKTLLVPFWFWSTIIFAINVIFAIFIHIWGYQYGGENALTWLSINGLLRLIGLNPFETMPTMWFLRTLFILVVISPLLMRCNSIGLVIMFMLTCSFAFIPGKSEAITKIGTNLLSIRGIFYFTLGLYIRRRGIRIGEKCWCIVISGLLLSIARIVFVEMGYYKNAIFLDSFQLLPLTYAVYWASNRISIPRSWASLSFPIYVTHINVILGISAFYGVVGVGGVGNITIIKGVCRFGCGLIVTVLICCSIRKLFPRASRIVFGGR